MIYIFLIVFGLIFGSFINALVWRLHKQENKKNKSQKYSVTKGRSMCPNCGHELAAKDLIPVISYCMLKGRCRYCKKPISAQYPAVELAMALVFVMSYAFWPTNLTSAGNITLFITWLASSVGLMALAVYDIKWMLLPNKIIYPTLFIAAAGNLIYLLGFSTDKINFLSYWVLSVLVASGIFLLLFVVSKGKWIGYGDVRLGLVTGTLLHRPILSFLMIFLASLLGTAAVLPLLIKGKKKMTTKFAYGPFLIVATFICILWGDQIINWYTNLLTP